LQRTAILNVVGLTPRHIGENTPYISAFLGRQENHLAHVEPSLPAVTSTVQATFLTGTPPSQHGIVANGWYDREFAETRFWKQSNHLVGGRKLWEHLRGDNPDFTCAKLFWWNNMYSSVDFSITPRPIYRSNGSKIFDIATHPQEIRKTIKKKIGKFPFIKFWGPASDIESSQWIARSAKWIEDTYQPSLNLVYLPHLDYNLQRLGPTDPMISIDLGQIDAVVGDLIRFFENAGVKVILLSEYGISDVNRPIHLNRIFRKKGWLEIRDEVGTDVLELGDSKAFAIADHQVAHIYVNDKSILPEVRETVAAVEGVEEIVDGAMKVHLGLEHGRSGDLIAVSDKRSWFTYYYWENDRKAPDFARCVDIHRKPGYDPVELFVNPKIKRPKLKVAGKKIRSLLGFRTLMDLIPLDSTLVKGSHGRLPEFDEDRPVLIGDFPELSAGARVRAVDVYGHLYAHCSRKG
jgi:predicted AlkP superfamily pyrophosphatase or phosphodiesterase